MKSFAISRHCSILHLGWSKLVAAHCSVLEIGKAEDPKSYRPIFLLCISYKILRRFIHTDMEQLLIHSSLKSRLDFNTEYQSWTNLFYSCKMLRTFLRLRRRPVSCLATWHWLMALSGPAASLASCWDLVSLANCQISTWFLWSCSLSEIEASP